jgi:hypothetical protein
MNGRMFGSPMRRKIRFGGSVCETAVVVFDGHSVSTQAA